MPYMTFTIVRTGQQYDDLRAAHDAATVGDTIAYNGTPAYRVTSRRRLDFV